MGLDTTHDCWHGPYSAFMRWREEVARAAGFPPLHFMESYFDPKECFLYDGGRRIDLLAAAEPDSLDRGTWLSHPMASGLRSLPIKWPENDVLVVLLNHSDCDGKIEWRDCDPLADRLAGLLPRMSEIDGHVRDIVGYRAITLKFIAGLRAAYVAQEDVEFH